MSAPTASHDDFLQDALQLFGEPRGNPEEEGQIRYGSLVLTVAPKEGKANTLMADHVFSPSLVIAERIERGLINLAGRTLIELGAGAALPSLLAGSLTNEEAPSFITVTDYPDSLILENLRACLHRNARFVAPQCCVETRSGYDNVFLSDLLHFHDSHPALLQSLSSLLKRESHARAYVGAGKYTPAYVCDGWLKRSGDAGFEWEEVVDEDVLWRGRSKVVWEGEVLDVDALNVRKANCRLWVGRWGESHLS